ncbi:hypothetical protein ABVV53_04205 [Novosphingobium sp. RD2P27]|uniref:Uncharacterized protein n=1 Tax=Novosphingobium kalidii TaxID=3230299 RepID=A0ABV2CYL5_9SPHN
MRKILFGSIAALGLVAAPAMAQNTTGTVGGGVAASTPDGSVAGGANAGTQMRNHDRKDRTPSTGVDRNTGAATHGSGAVYTDRNPATGGASAGGVATGDQQTSTGVGAHGTTDPMNSAGEVHGDATATSTMPTTMPN